MKNTFLLAGILFFGLVSCKKQEGQPENQIDENQITTEFVDEHNAQNSLDWAGEYQGVLPCADCEGIKLTLVLHPDHTFYGKQEYLGKDENSVFEAKGSFVWDNTGLIITIEGDETFRKSYKVVEEGLIHLDNDRNEITGNLEEHYRLTKIR